MKVQIAGLSAHYMDERILNVYAVVNREKLAAAVTSGDRGTS